MADSPPRARKSSISRSNGLLSSERPPRERSPSPSVSFSPIVDVAPSPDLLRRELRLPTTSSISSAPYSSGYSSAASNSPSKSRTPSDTSPSAFVSYSPGITSHLSPHYSNPTFKNQHRDRSTSLSSSPTVTFSPILNVAPDQNSNSPPKKRFRDSHSRSPSLTSSFSPIFAEAPSQYSSSPSINQSQKRSHSPSPTPSPTVSFSPVLSVSPSSQYSSSPSKNRSSRDHSYTPSPSVSFSSIVTVAPSPQYTRKSVSLSSPTTLVSSLSSPLSHIARSSESPPKMMPTNLSLLGLSSQMQSRTPPQNITKPQPTQITGEDTVDTADTHSLPKEIKAQSLSSHTNIPHPYNIPESQENTLTKTNAGYSSTSKPASTSQTPTNLNRSSPIPTNLDTSAYDQTSSTDTEPLVEVPIVVLRRPKSKDSNLTPYQHKFSVMKINEDNPIPSRSENDKNKEVKVKDIVPQPPKEDNATSTTEEPVWKRRLSNLFTQPTEEELLKEEKEKQESEETSRLLPGGSQKGSTLSLILASEELLQGEVEPKKLTIRNKGIPRINFQEASPSPEALRRPFDKKEERSGGLTVYNENRESWERNGRRRNSDSDSSNSSSEDDEERWDDTICSNRSSYFKLYYGLQRGVGDKGTEKGQASRFSTQNSLTSLIREKMGQNAPPPAPPARTKADIGLMVLVVILFIIIVVGISLIYYFYHQHLLELKIFNRVKFKEDGRILHLYNDDWKSQTTAHLGTTLDPHMLPEDCTHYLHYMHEHNKTIKSPKPEGGGTYKEFVCLDWTYQARLQLRKLYDYGDVHCYLVWWVGNHNQLTLRDCVHMGGEDGTWWGGGEMTVGGYPLNKANIPPTPMVTGELGRHPWGKLVRRAWMSSTASLLTLPDYSHAKVSINYKNDGKICMESFPDPMAKDPTPTLEYTLCRASNMTSLFKYLHKEAKEKVRKLTKNKSKVLDEHKIVTELDDNNNETKTALDENNNIISDNDREIVEEVKASLDEVIDQGVLERVVNRMEHPVWVPWLSANQPDLTNTTVILYVKNIVEKNYGMWGHILLPPTWQAKPGTLDFDPIRFPDPKHVSESLEDMGFKLAVSIHPFVSVNVPAFDSGTEEGYWIKQKDSVLPALSQYKNRYPAALTDFTNPRASHWYSSKLKHLQDSYKVERFHLQQPNSYNFPTFHDYHEPLSGPDGSLAHFVKAVSDVSAPLSSDGSIGTPPAPTFVTVGEYGEGWRGLETLVARVLSLGSTGSPFVDVGAIGGLAKPGHVPDRELYIRWIQTAAFMPAFQINTLPHVYHKDVEDLAKEFTKKRQELVLPRLREDLPSALKYGTPLAKPLFYHFPDDEESAQISDQWILGNDLLVAPVVQKGVRIRDIYLPPGIWKDLLDGRMRRGGRYIKEYKVPLTQLPHFEQIRPEDLD